MIDEVVEKMGKIDVSVSSIYTNFGSHLSSRMLPFAEHVSNLCRSQMLVLLLSKPFMNVQEKISNV